MDAKKRLERIEQGRCGNCGTSPLATKTLCQRCREAVNARKVIWRKQNKERDREYHKRKYQETKAHRNEIREARRKLLRSKGLCDCGEPLISKTMCEKCLHSCNENARRNRQKWKVLGLCFRCIKNKTTEGALYCQRCIVVRKEKLRQLKLAAYRKLGGIFCKCCGISEEVFLTIDHVNNDGTEERKKLGIGGARIYRLILKLSDTSRYQVLCWNCQAGKRFCGTCPHQFNCTKTNLGGNNEQKSFESTG